MSRYLFLVIWFLGGLATGTARAEDRQVNTYTSSSQEWPAIAMDATGDFVVTWTSFGSPATDQDQGSIQSQRFSSDGSFLQPQFQVNTYTTGIQRFSSVTMAADGDFVVVWERAVDFASDYSIQGQRYASDGSPLSGQFQVNTYTTGFHRFPSAAMAANGDFVVAWRRADVLYGVGGVTLAQRYASDGSPLGDEIVVSAGAGLGGLAAAAMDADGNFIVTWQSEGSGGTDSSNLSIQARRYASDGSPVSAQFQVNTFTSGPQYLPAVAMDADGDFVVSWTTGISYTDLGVSVQAQRYASDGLEIGGQFQVNAYTTGNQKRPAVAMGADGDFVIAWESSRSAGSDSFNYSIQARSFAAGGSVGTHSVQINSYVTGRQEFSSVAMDAAGRFVITWTSEGSSGTDASDRSIQISSPTFADGFESGDTSRWSTIES